ncbi:MAG: OmpW family outer membrane protein [Woeseiaceae bacterium]|nr:OmpW family outer membrane protein [Woeseiaceae bacterium]
MKHLALIVKVGVLSLLIGTNALADDDKYYVTGNVGIGFLGSEDLTYSDSMLTATVKADFDASFAGGGTFGYYLTDNWRVEGEIMYRRNDMKDITLGGVGASTGGDFASLSLGVSALYEFQPTDNPRLKTYVGAGVAFVQEIDIDFEIDSVETSFETDETGLQLQAGARYDLNDRLFLDFTAKYLTVSGAKMEFPADTSRTVEADYSPLTLSLGLGWRF